jgi:hypothetical protein
MTLYYFDSSGLVKNYLQEQGTEWVQTTIATPGHMILVSKIAGPEVISAFTRKRNRGEITETYFQGAVSRFQQDLANQFLGLAVSDELLEAAMEIVKSEGLRAYDAVQLATALQLGSVTGIDALTFVSADSMLCRVAERRQLQVINPEKVGQENH